MSETRVAAQYSSGTLENRVLAALQQIGKNPASVSAADLAPVDQFHFGGRGATLDLAHLAGITPEMVVLDVGGGMGGAARTLASEFGCRVVVLDLTEEFCRVGETLTRMVGLSDLVTFRQGDALDLPFDDESFNCVWTQHATMNIEDKERLFRQVHRVLRTGGRYALHEVLAGPLQPPYYPVPWAREPAVSFLQRPVEVRQLLGLVGFREVAWLDTTEGQTLPQVAQGTGEQAPALGLHILTEDMPGRLANSVRNRAEGRTVLGQGVYERM